MLAAIGYSKAENPKEAKKVAWAYMEYFRRNAYEGKKVFETLTREYAIKTTKIYADGLKMRFAV